MFGLSWAQIGIIVLVGAFVLGPERIPTAMTFITSNLKKVRTMAAGAQTDLRREIGPELDELRRQVADLRSLTEIQGLRDLQDLHPQRLLSKNLLGDEFSGGITGFLGLAADKPKVFSLEAPAPGSDLQSATATQETTSTERTQFENAVVVQDHDIRPTGSEGVTALPPSMIKSSITPADQVPTTTGTRRLVAAGQLPPFDAEGT